MSLQAEWPKVLIDPLFGVNVVVACPTCAALVADDESHRAFHMAWHERIDGRDHAQA